jgi:hypothetical protein
MDGWDSTPLGTVGRSLLGNGFSIAETSPLILTVALAFFIVVSFSLEYGLHRLHHKLAHQLRLGMLAALDNMKNELMLLGVASLLLITFENTISSWCGESQRCPALILHVMLSVQC